MPRHIQVEGEDVSINAFLGFLLALERKYKYKQDNAVDAFFEKHRNIDAKEREAMLGLESKKISEEPFPKSALKKLIKKMGLKDELDKYRSEGGALDLKDNACRCFSCFCVDYSCIFASPCALNSLKCCCCKLEGYTKYDEECCDEEQGCCEVRKKCCCCFKEMQCPPGKDIGIGLCGIYCWGQTRDKDRPSEQLAGSDHANVDFKDNAFMIYSCCCTHCSIVSYSPCLLDSMKCGCMESQTALSCNNEANDGESGCCEGKSKVCCLYNEVQCPPGKDIGMACCGIVCIGQKAARELDEAYAPMQDSMM